MLANTTNHRPGPHADELTVCVPGALLAAAPAAEAPPVFVDDSGTRRKLIRFTGLVVMLALVGFLGLVGVALAVPSVGATVGLGDVTPFMVPGAAAKPPPPAPVAVAVKKRIQTVAPVKRQAPKPKVVQVPKPAPKKEAPVVVAPPKSAPPAEKPPVVVDPPVVDPPAEKPPVVEPPVLDPPKKADAGPAVPVLIDPAPVAQGG